MIRVIIFLLFSFGLVGAPKKDFQLLCDDPIVDTRLIVKYTNIRSPKIDAYRLYIAQHTISNDGYYPDKYIQEPEYEDFELKSYTKWLNDEDDDKYYFGPQEFRNGVLEYRIHIDRKTLGVRLFNLFYECDFIDDKTFNEQRELWEKWQKEWRIKYPTEKPKNKI